MIEVTENELIYTPEPFKVKFDIVTGKVQFPDNFIKDYLSGKSRIYITFLDKAINITSAGKNRRNTYKLEKDNSFIDRDLVEKIFFALSLSKPTLKTEPLVLHFSYEEHGVFFNYNEDFYFKRTGLRLDIFKTESGKNILRTGYWSVDDYWDKTEGHVKHKTYLGHIKLVYYIQDLNKLNLQLSDYKLITEKDFTISYLNLTNQYNLSLIKTIKEKDCHELYSLGCNVIYIQKPAPPFLYWNIEEDLTVSFLDINRYYRCIEENKDLYNNNLRQKIKLGKFLNYFMDVTPKRLEEIVTKFKHHFNPTVEIKEVKGEDIKTAYLESNYSDVKGDDTSLIQSCMRYDASQTKLDFYSKNSSVVSCLVVYLNDLVAARALIWETDQGRVMDRIYSVDKRFYKHFRDYCIVNNIQNIYEHRIPKKSESNLDNMGIDFWANKYTKKFTVNLDFIFNKETPREYFVELKSVSYVYPYLDNFAQINESQKVLVNCFQPIDRKFYEKVLQNIPPEDIHEYNKHEASELEYYWCEVSKKYWTEKVEYSETDKIWAYTDYLKYCVIAVENLDESYFEFDYIYDKDKYVWLEHIDEYVLTDLLEWSEWGQEYVFKEAAIKVFNPKTNQEDYIYGKDLTQFVRSVSTVETDEDLKNLKEELVINE